MRTRNYRQMICLWSCLMAVAWSASAQAAAPSQFGEIFRKIESQCPDHYPETVTPIPEQEEFAKMTGEQFIGMLGSWNPAMRKAVAAELGNRQGAEVDRVLAARDTSRRSASS